VAVDDARHQRQAVVYRLARRPKAMPDPGDPPAVNRDLAARGRGARPVEDQRVTEKDVVHDRGQSIMRAG
jgi:hypothetical protein